MSESEEEYDELGEQLRQEKLEQQRRADCSDIEHGRQRVDPDGTVYEWDSVKMAYFPKIDDDFIAQYQMSYGNYNGDTTAATNVATTTAATTTTAEGEVASQHYEFCKNYYAEHGKYPDFDKHQQDYYNYYYSYYYRDGAKSTNAEEQAGEGEEPTSVEGKVKGGERSESGKNDKTKKSGDSKEEDKEKEKKYPDKAVKDSSGSKQSEQTDESHEKAYKEYCEYYQKYYSQYYGQHGQGEASTEQGQQEDDSEKNQANYDYWAWYCHYYGNAEAEVMDTEEEGKGCGAKTTDGTGQVTTPAEDSSSESKKTKKRKEGWFDIEDEKNTNVYVSGLPSDITEDEFKELMNKCGMILYDPRTRKPKLKLYRDPEGNPKGDGLCCYIKPESVSLALQMLDDYEVRGQKISVDVAKFEMKGNFDPKRRKKLSNREKKKLKEHTEKLFDWRPDKPLNYRGRHERTVVLKNVFNPAEFENDPKNIQKLREDVRAQCSNHGTVKKVNVYDRHPECVVTVMFSEVEEADMAKEGLHGRYFRGRQITAETWDGQTKYAVQETEQEQQERLQRWQEYLATGGKTEATSGPNIGGPLAQDKAAQGKAPPAQDKAAQGKAPPAQDKAAQGEAPPAQGEVPAAQGNATPAQAKMPPAQGEAPPAQGEVPPAQGKATPAQAKMPPAQGKEPPAQGEVPPAQDKAAQGKPPPAQGEVPPAQGEVPPAQDEVPPAQGEAPPAQGEVPPAQGKAPPAQDKAAQGKAPPAQGEAPPAQGEATPAQDESPPAQAEVPPAQGEAPPAQTEVPPAQDKSPPAKDEVPPAQAEVPPAQAEVPPAQAEAPPAQDTTPPAKDTTPPAKDTAPTAVDTGPSEMDTRTDSVHDTTRQTREVEGLNLEKEEHVSSDTGGDQGHDDAASEAPGT